ncbi:SDR family NAD(P)-dependent oxidoreductase [Rhodococcus aerolatus]
MSPLPRRAPRHRVAGRTAVVTGAGSGIGRALAHELVRRGAVVALSDVDGAAAERTAADCRASGGTARAWRLDVTDRAAVLAHADEVAAELGPVHLVVCNAGVSVNASVAESTEEDMRWVMEVNHWGMVHGAQAFLPHLTASGDGQLAVVSSLFGLVAAPGQAAYNASKFAVRGFAEALRMELRLAGTPVAVSTVHPGGIRTNIARNARVGASEDRDAAAAAFETLARTSPETAARVILDGLARGRSRILVGPDAVAVAVLPRLLGARYTGLVELVSKRLG